jgi:predicted transcriptional regulator
VLGHYRSRLAIIADILKVVKDRPKKTQIMYQANLSFKVLQRYLAEITGASLANFDDEANCYVMTEKGFRFLTAYQEYSKTSKKLENRVNEARSKQKLLEKLCSEQA